MGDDSVDLGLKVKLEEAQRVLPVQIVEDVDAFRASYQPRKPGIRTFETNDLLALHYSELYFHTYAMAWRGYFRHQDVRSLQRVEVALGHLLRREPPAGVSVQDPPRCYGVPLLLYGLGDGGCQQLVSVIR